jgi:nucleotide-binding universal stress UspA family protein
MDHEPFRSIVWATDGSALSAGGYVYVRELCEGHGSRLCIVHIVRLLATCEVEPRIATLKAMTSALRRWGVDASLHVVRDAIGSPARHIAEVAQMIDADLVLVTTRRPFPAATLPAGSVTQGVVAGSACPVLVVPTGPR